MKFYISGKENLNTSIDMDNAYLKKWIKFIGNEITEDINKADVVFSVWWNNTPVTNKKTIICLSNFIKKDCDKVKKFLEIENQLKPIWVCPSQNQKNIIENIIGDSKRVKFLPFFVNEIYYKNEGKFLNVYELFAKNNLIYTNIKEDNVKNLSSLEEYLSSKIKIGSFQRDSEGSNLLKPKWQKGPDNIVEWVKYSKFKNDIVFFLSGPRRHYIVNELTKEKIKFIYFGNFNYIKQQVDDININSFKEEVIYSLYQEIDCYLVGSRLEGGPKSLIECALLSKPVLSSNVGLSSHFVEKKYIKENFKSSDFDDFIHDVKNKKYKFIKKIIDLNYNLNALREIIE